MANLKDLRNRINSVKSTQKITRAMQMVAASKLRRAQEAVSAARPYSERLERVMNSLAGSVQEVVGAPPLLAGTGENKTHLLIVATADRGLCGSFNVNIVRLATQHIAALEAEGKTVKILCVGKKGAAILQSRYRDQILEVIDLSHIRNIGFADSQPISAKVLEMFEAGAFDVCTLYFSRFGSIISQIPTAQRLIPMSVDSAQSEVTEDGAGASVAPSAIYEYEPDEREILEELLPRNIAFQIFRALLENAASEQGSRMSAMDNATRNAGELIDQLTLDYNRSRQGVITSELIEIISGAEAL